VKKDAVAERIETLLVEGDPNAFIEALKNQDPEALAEALKCIVEELRKIGFDAYKAAFEMPSR